jgi:N-methylhydantoinase A
MFAETLKSSHEARGENKYIIGIDVGGTFTDAVAIECGNSLFSTKIVHGKASTTPQNLTEGVINSLADLSNQMGISTQGLLSQTLFIGHGTTVGTNALIMRRGAKVGLITTKGFEDTTHIQRAVGKIAGLSEMERKHRTVVRQPIPIVPKRLIRGVVERVDCFGSIIRPIDEENIREMVQELLDLEVETIAVCLLWSFLNDSHERKVKEVIQKMAPELPITLSSELVPKIRENARSNTVIINAYIDKICKQYFKSLNNEIRNRRFRFNIASMQVFGGVTDCNRVSSISTIDSGPVGGVMGSKYLGTLLGFPNIITTDMGGTSFDVSAICQGSELMGREYFGAPGVLARFETLVPRVDIRSLGAGGGTIAWVDQTTRSLKVGPMSAGASPGPVFYDKGGQDPTVSDIDLLLGYLNPEYFFGGKIKVNQELSREAIGKKLAKPMGMSDIEVASGVFDIVNNMMSDAIRGYIVEKGFDPKEFIIFAFGGAGPVHASSYGELTGARKTIILNMAPTFSAFGIAVSDILHKKSTSLVMPEPFDADKINNTFLLLEKRAQEEMKEEGLSMIDLEISYSMDVKYSGQIHELNISVPRKQWVQEEVSREIRRIFMEKYEMVYGKGAAYTKGGVEVVALNVDILGKLPKPIFQPENFVVGDGSEAIKTFREVFFGEIGHFIRIPIFDMQLIKPGHQIQGPAIIESSQTTVVILPNRKGVVDNYRNIVIENLDHA